jgi:hypothetical protein
VLEKNSKVDQTKKAEDGELFATAIQIKVSATPTMKVPKIKVQPSWSKPAFKKEDVDAPPEFFIAPLEEKCGVSIEFSTEMDFTALRDPDLLFDVLLISFQEQTQRSLATASSEDESFIEYTW